MQNLKMLIKLVVNLLTANKSRNFFLVLTIIITTFLFSSIFSLIASFTASFNAQAERIGAPPPDLEDTYLMLGVILLISLSTGYLLIYNLSQIAVTLQVRLFGLLKTIGASIKHIRFIMLLSKLLLCAVGIPIGLLLAAIGSMYIVPLMVEASGVDAGGAIISHSPLIYIGSAISTLTTVLLCTNPAKRKAASITPIEAMCFVKHERNEKPISATMGNTFVFAFRNVFRQRKPAVIVLLALSISVISFVTDAFMNLTLDTDLLMKYSIVYDFSITSRSFDRINLQEDFVNEIRNLSVVADIRLLTRGETFATNGDWISLMGIDPLMLQEVKYSTITPIDINAFSRGEIALVDITARNSIDLDYGFVFDLAVPDYTLPVQIEVGGSADIHTRYTMGGPTSWTSGSAFNSFRLIVSNEFLQTIYPTPNIRRLEVIAESGYDKELYLLLNEIIDNNYIAMRSRIQQRNDLEAGRTAAIISSVGILFVMFLSALINYINVVGTSIIIRKQEFAILESIGLEKTRLRKILAFEGLCYCGIVLLVSLLGNIILYPIFIYLRNRYTSLLFVYPVIPVTIIFLILLVVCAVVPVIMYKVINKLPLTTRLKERD